MNPKYVVVCTKVGTKEIRILPHWRSHDSILDEGHIVPVSAGFFSYFVKSDLTVGVSCHGRSVSLNLPSRKEDDFLLRQYLGLL